MGNAGALWPEALLFDLDGTIADSFGAIRHALALAAAEVGLPERDLAWVQRHVGRGSPALILDAADGDGDLAERLLKLYLDRYREVFLDETPAVDGAVGVLGEVWRRTGGRVGVVSNKRSDLSRMWLRHHGLARFVTIVAGPDSAGVGKPDPRAVLPVLDTLGASPDHALLVGDMAVDVVTGRNSGIAVVGIAGPTGSEEELREAGAAGVVADLRDLLPWLAEHGRGWR